MFRLPDADVRLMQMVFSNSTFDLSPFSDNTSRAGGKIINQQPGLHARIAQIASRLGSTSGKPSITNRAAASLKEFGAKVVSIASYSIKEIEGGTVVVAGIVPVLDEADVDKLEERLLVGGQGLLGDPDYAEEALAMLIATYREAFRARDADLEFSRLDNFLPEINKALARLTWLEFRSGESDEITRIEANFKARLVEYDVLAERNNSNVVEMRRSIDNLGDQLNAVNLQTQRTSSEFDNIDKRIQATEAAFFERIGTKETQGLWQWEAKKAAISFYSSGVFLLAALFSIPAFVYCYRDQLLLFLQNVEQGAVQLAGADRPATAAALVLGRLLLLTIPVGSLIWAIKLVVRFNIRSMLLMDDANQRVTMLKTYLFLVSQQAASQEDRGALLEAMFRRAPGHGPETIEPPSMVDIMNYGKEVGRTSAG